MNVLLIGNSFIRRAQDDLFPNSARVDLHPAPPGWIAQRARATARALRISDHYRYVFTIANDLNLISQLAHIRPRAIELQPAVVLIQVGSNDLAHLRNYNDQAARQSADTVIQFALGLPVRRVIINAALPRQARKTVLTTFSC